MAERVVREGVARQARLRATGREDSSPYFDEFEKEPDLEAVLTWLEGLVVSLKDASRVAETCLEMLSREGRGLPETPWVDEAASSEEESS